MNINMQKQRKLSIKAKLTLLNNLAFAPITYMCQVLLTLIIKQWKKQII